MGNVEKSTSGVLATVPFRAPHWLRPCLTAFLNIPFSIWCFIKTITLGHKIEILMKIEKRRV